MSSPDRAFRPAPCIPRSHSIIDPTIAPPPSQASTAEIIQSSPISRGPGPTHVLRSPPTSSRTAVRARRRQPSGLVPNAPCAFNIVRGSPRAYRARSPLSTSTACRRRYQIGRVLRTVLQDRSTDRTRSRAWSYPDQTETDGLELFVSPFQFKGGGEQFERRATTARTSPRHFLCEVATNHRKSLRRGTEVPWMPEDYIFRSSATTRRLDRSAYHRSACIHGVTWGHVWTYYAYNLRTLEMPSSSPDYGQALVFYRRIPRLRAMAICPPVRAISVSLLGERRPNR